MSILTLDNFSFHSKLGSGVYGETYFVTKKDGIDRGRRYAIKASIKDKVRYSVLEAETLKRLNTAKFTIKLIYAFQNVYATFLCLELAGGGDLSILRRNNIQLDHQGILFYAIEILSGLIEIHKLGVVHRDIKTDNILLTKEGHIRIADFGTSIILNKNEAAYCFRTSPLFAVSRYVDICRYWIFARYSLTLGKLKANFRLT